MCGIHVLVATDFGAGVWVGNKRHYAGLGANACMYDLFRSLVCILARVSGPADEIIRIESSRYLICRFAGLDPAGESSRPDLESTSLL